MTSFDQRRELVSDFLTRRLEHYLDVLKQMVNINSFTENPEGINAVGAYTGEVFQSLGFSTEIIPSVNKRYGSHHIYKREGSTPITVALVSHLDTVYTTEEEEAHDFFWRVEGDRIYGPGTIDIKGGTAMIYAVLDTIKEVAPDVFEAITWEVYLDASEEDDARDFGALCIERFHENTIACLVFEAGILTDDEEWLLVSSRKGRAVFNINVQGRSSHAGTAHPKGANALVQMADIVQKMAALTDYDRDLTVNVGTIRGGTVSNRVPHHAFAKVEMRAFTTEAYNEARQAILDLQDYSSVASLEDGFPCTIRVEIERETQPWPRNNETEALFQVWSGIGEQLGMKMVRQDRGGLSDANLVWAEVPTIDGMGPAGANAHCSEHSQDGSKEQEYIFVPSFVPKSRLNVLALLALAEQKLQEAG
ncbi:MAG: M20/M25/M40 family metallo-hydrolase [Deltaproteobacteria bacterium]|nr:MAG: M20/M25/M40 family metallo-hydrolase [Deltaproteobacteria bacterium]